MAGESVSPPPKVYTQAQIQEILNAAIAQQAWDGEFSRAQLYEIAEELEIQPQILQQAEESWLNQQSVLQERQAFDDYRMSQLKHRTGRWLILSGALAAMGAVISTIPFLGVLWIFPAGIICLLTAKLGLFAWSIFQTNEAVYEEAFRRWLRKRQLSQFVNRWWTRISSI
ncbi:hypothetical protein [Lyngbya confervoides]|uniref:2TM domain-containing protein n=1 Tax=Lyngbya confervoides BDU141951 TaxID=1574623 RepID=A0ABD4T3V6_9CYAN|nr:hypothetical protein [Lyngbya confervoides]MCM1983128.1 hypothetical protein [Lyngbya confervoides BDU141951]